MSKGPWKKAPSERKPSWNAKDVKSFPASTAEPALDPEIEPVPEEDEPMATSKPADGGHSIDKLADAVEKMAAAQAQQAEFMLLMQKQLAQQSVRHEARPEERVSTRHMMREREPEGVKDRDGNILVRRSFESLDPFELPAEFVASVKAENYSIEWKSEFVYNQQQTTYLSKLMTNGHWAPVLNNRLPGRYPGEPDEPIRHDGLILMERPAGLTAQARREDQMKARDQVNIQHKNWGVSSRRRDYFDPSTPEAEKHTLLRKTLEVADASWQPELQIASDGDL